MLQPVNRLPPEILSCITQHVPDDPNEDARSIIPLTHVCRYWRESITSTPQHWTTISSHRKRLAALCLERAKAAPLEIHLKMHEIREDPQFLDLLLPYTKNTETLRVDGLLTAGDLAHLPFRSASNIRSLSLSDGGIGKWDRSIDPFKPSSHTLRYLSLTGIPLYPSFLNLRTLTEFTIYDSQCNLHLDTFLDFLEGNRLLTRADIRIRFIEPSLRSSRRRAAIESRLHRLRIVCYDMMDGKALVSSIALPKGAELEVDFRRGFCIDMGVNDFLSDISTTHLSNLQSPTFMQYHVHTTRVIHLFGPNGTASFIGDSYLDPLFVEFPRLPLTNIRRFHLDTYGWELIRPSPGHRVFHHLSSFPALETFTVGSETDLLRLLSPLLSNPSASPSLKTLGFEGCLLTEGFMEGLIRFASDRKNTTSAWICHVVIADPEGEFPSDASIKALEECVPVVDVRIATELPMDLTR